MDRRKIGHLKKKNIARLVVQGISILGILFGFSCFFFAISTIFSILRGKLDITYGWLFYLAVMLVLGAFLLYPSYLMLRMRSFGVMKSISVLFALSLSGLVRQLDKVFLATSANEKTARLIEDITGLASLLSIVVFYFICIKLLKRLLKAANVPKEISSTQHSTDKQ